MLRSYMKARPFILTAVTVYLASFVAGYTLSSTGIPWILTYKAVFENLASKSRAVATVYELLRRDRLAEAIGYTFANNLLYGALLQTGISMIPGLGFILGLTYSVAVGFTVGVTYVDVIGLNPISTATSLGTVGLELILSYGFSVGLGLYASYSTVKPKGWKKKVEAYKSSLRDCAKLYVFVLVFLSAAAVWEITGLYLSMNV